MTKWPDITKFGKYCYKEGQFYVITKPGQELLQSGVDNLSQSVIIIITKWGQIR